MNSLEYRLQFGLALSFVLLMGLFWLAGNVAITHLTEDFVTSRLEHDAEGLLAALEPQADGFQVNQGHLNPIYKQPFSGHYYQIRFAGGHLIGSRSLWDQSLDAPELSVGDVHQYQITGPAGQRLLLWAKGFRIHGMELTVAVAEDLSFIGEHRNRFQWAFALMAVLGVVVLLATQRMLVRRSFRRLEPVREDIRRLEQGKMGQLSEDVPTEIMPLVKEFNRLLTLLAQRLERSRNALGNLAHALKGPLNLLVQYQDSEEMGTTPERAAMLREQTERIRLLMDRELKRARLAGEGSPGQLFIPQDELPPLAELLGQIYREREMAIEWAVAPQVEPFGDREDMLELLGNLLDNACKWAKSRVACHMADGEKFRIEIEDDGEGCSDESLDQLVRRGVRLDESVEGSGLGLAIAKDIVKLYGGEMRFGHSERLGGLRVEVSFKRR